MAVHLVNQAPPLMIGSLNSAVAVGYYGLPVQLLLSAADAVAQFGIVTGASSAELSARGDVGTVGRLGI
jgi:hypothetical protein